MGIRSESAEIGEALEAEAERIEREVLLIPEHDENAVTVAEARRARTIWPTGDDATKEPRMSPHRPPASNGGKLKAMTAMEAVREAADQLTQAELVVVLAKRKLNRATLQAYEKGNDATRIGNVLGLSRQRIWQLIDKARKEAV